MWKGIDPLIAVLESCGIDIPLSGRQSEAPASLVGFKYSPVERIGTSIEQSSIPAEKRIQKNTKSKDRTLSKEPQSGIGRMHHMVTRESILPNSFALNLLGM